MLKNVLQLLCDIGGDLKTQAFPGAGERDHSRNIVFTNWIYARMQVYGISEAYIIDVLQSGQTRKSRPVYYQYTSQSYLTTRQYPGREVGVFWCYDGAQKILRSCWKRPIYC